MNRYFVMYRKLYEHKDRLFEVQAESYEACMAAMPERGVPKEVQHMYIHEHRPNGSVVEVLSYENPDIMGKKKKPETKAVVATTPAVKATPTVVTPLWKKPPLPAVTGNTFREHYYTARELA